MTSDTEMGLWFERSGNLTNRKTLREGHTVRCYASGGGGHGTPLDRDPQAIEAEGHICPIIRTSASPFEGPRPHRKR